MRKYLFVLLSLLSCTVYADNYPVDSTDLQPPTTTAGKRSGFVLTSGSLTTYCVNGSPGCLVKGSTSLCPIGYKPLLSTAANSGSSRYGIKSINLQNLGVLISNNAYWIQLSKAYIQGVDGSSAIGVSYTIFCV